MSGSSGVGVGTIGKGTTFDERKCFMAISPLAGKPAPKEMLIDPNQLERENTSIVSPI